MANEEFQRLVLRRLGDLKKDRQDQRRDGKMRLSGR